MAGVASRPVSARVAALRDRHAGLRRVEVR
jgi:hypothetical protein